MLTHKRLLQILHYEPSTGIFSWKIKLGHRSKTVAGSSVGHGYIRIVIEGEKYYAHRLAWFYVRKKWPKKIDHINGQRADNRFINLREADDLGNARNRKAGRNNSSGFKGVSLFRRDGTWRAQITVNWKNIHLGYFPTPEKASEAYSKAARKYFGSFVRM